MKHFLPFYILLFISTLHHNSTLAQITINGPAGSGAFGTDVYTLPNGNYLITDPEYDEGPIENVGAVYLYDGATHQLISTLKGSSANDKIGTYIQSLSDDLYAVISLYWNNETASEAGAITWCNSSTGIEGVVSISNSLVGSSTEDHVGSILIPLKNGNYVTAAPEWDNGEVEDVGAVTWIDGTAPLTGEVSTANSLVGTTEDDRIAAVGILPLVNGNYVVFSPFWDKGEIMDVGAVTWVDGTGLITGEVSSANSFTGSGDQDMVGFTGEPLTNGNYVILSPLWNGDGAARGAVTWCTPDTPTLGEVNSGNSLVGSTDGDLVGIGYITPLTNGNYVVVSPGWDNEDIIDAGAVTWADGTTGITGEITSANSLVGSTELDAVGASFVTPLSNGNYVVASPFWSNDGIESVGAATWASGTTGISGEINYSNSLIGNAYNDQVGKEGAIALTNGNYVVSSPNWNNDGVYYAGAVTWGDGTTGITGNVSSSNSLVGSTQNDQVGYNPVTPLSNGNYVVSSPNWNSIDANMVGAATWGDGTIGTSGVVSSSNSLIGSTENDRISNTFIADFPNGNYLVISGRWNNGGITEAGAITWGNGATGITGTVSPTNSLVGSTAEDGLGQNGTNLKDGSMLVASLSWDNGLVVDAGAYTYINAATGLTGTISPCNSVIGNAEGLTYFSASPSSIYDYTLVGISKDNNVIVYNPSFKPLANDEDTQTYTLTGDPGPVTTFINEDCRVIASIKPSTPNPASGSVTAKVWVEDDQPAKYVKRHYEITPDDNAATSTSEITLYFSQEEFNAYNTQQPAPALLLPTSSTDDAKKVNVLIEKFAGKSSDGSGSPTTYTNGSETINPDEDKIVWNPLAYRWEITFDVNGFSGFFLKTAIEPLPVRLVSFTAKAVENTAQLQWSVADVVNFSHFEVEKSSNSKQFTKVDNVPLANSNYLFTDTKAATSPLVYYRLKLVDSDGSYTYSRIESVRFDKSQLLASGYPNPFTATLTLVSNSNQTATVTNLVGNTIANVQLIPGENQVSTNNWPNGLYLVRTSNGELIKVIKE